MAKELDKNYDAAAIEEKWSAFWLKNETNHSEVDAGGDPYTIMIPPPNVTGILHMGHALNTTIQDILIRWQRMQGKNSIWVPGTDHAGIATQNVVERSLAKEGKTRDDLGREAFLDKVWEWKEQYGSTIVNQLKRLGCACDWQRERFTMDEGLSDAVLEVFVRLYDKGLIYRGKYLVNWCPRCQTALSDEESEHRDMAGKLWYMKYAYKDDPEKFVMVATTRPETMLGDTAIAVNPADVRYKEMVGKTVILPLLNREIPIIADDFVDPEFGTGAVKVTPAHDPNDFEMGRRHEMVPIDVMNDDGTMNENAGPYAKMDRFDCRKKIVADLEEQGLIDKIEDHQNAVGHCYRCHTVVEPRLSKQWFVKMKPLAERAIEVVKDGRVTFVPDRWSKVYLGWMENIRDWCISRQIWWGHRIPVYYCGGCNKEWAAKSMPESCPDCGSAEVTQDEDVLDTWFSSWLWPFSTLGWPEKTKDLEYYYPTNDLVTASEIIFFWVARMIMAGLEFMDDIPFSRVYIHGTVRDDQGRKMSKSLGNSIDPLDVIDKFSADALRFSLMMLTATGQDLYLSDDKFEIGRNFGTKLWNAARFIQMNTEKVPDFDVRCFEELELDQDLMSFDDQYVLAGLHGAIAACNDNLDKCRFNDAAATLYEFVWHRFCDWYVEYSKTVLYGEDEARRVQVLKLTHYVFANSLKLLHPIMPHITEELWHAMGYGDEGTTISREKWPEISKDELAAWGIASDIVSFVAEKYDLIRAGRTLRADYNLPPSKKIDFVIKPSTDDAGKLLEADLESIATFLRAAEVKVELGFEPGKAMPSGVGKLGSIFMPVDGLIDVDAELERLTKQKDKVTSDLQRVTKKLENVNFVKKAPANVIDRQKEIKTDLLEKDEKLNKLIQALSS